MCLKVWGGSEGWSGLTDFLVWKQNQIAKLGLGQACGEGDGEDQRGLWEKASGNSPSQPSVLWEAKRRAE